MPTHRRFAGGGAAIEVLEQTLLCHATEELLGERLEGDDAD